MKKLLIVLLVALLTLALVACGGDTDTTDTKTTTDPVVTTTVPAEGGDDTTPAEGDETTAPTTTGAPETTEPETEGEDLIYDYDCMDMLDSSAMSFMMFEDFHVDLDYNVALVVKMNANGGLYSEFFITLMDEETGEPTGEYMINDAYSHQIILDGKTFDISRITLANYTDSGWIRFDLGADFTFEDYEYDEDGYHYYTAIWNVLDDEGKVAYFANLTEYNVDGKYPHLKPQKKELVPDPDVPAGVEKVPNSGITLIDAPTVTNGETAENLFDDDVSTKLCTGDNGKEHAIVVGFASPQSIIGLSFVNGNDNDPYHSRTLVDFEVYVSEDGNNWNEAPDFVSTAPEGLDKSTISGNYTENYYDFGKTLTGSYIMIVANNGDTYQMSELIFYAG
ncbi:MAG: discoidin domain-containing protein [Clostridia bacterium]|nr:discoidin domain-containing protein [Clostridia bacterium]